LAKRLSSLDLELFTKYRHPRRFQQDMREMGMVSALDELRCPRCGRLIKPKGVPLNQIHRSIWSGHVGSLKCLLAAFEGGEDGSKK